MISKDTHPEIDRKYRELLMAKTPSERVAMGCAMFDTAREIAAASLDCIVPQSQIELRIALFRRMYGHEVSEEYMNKLFAHWETVAAQ